MPAAARTNDMHTCPLVDPASGTPHTGGPITGPGASTVLIGKFPAAKMGDMCTCVGPPDSIIKGSATVFIEKMAAVRIGDMTAHGGSVAAGFPSVIIGG